MKHLREWGSLVQGRVRAAMGNRQQRVSLLLVVGIAGMLLLCLSEWWPASSQSAASNSQTEESSADSYAASLEKRLESLISATEGAGKTLVMVTLEAGQTTRYAADTEETADSRRYEPVRAGSEGLVEEIGYPRVQGVAVVCEGGDDPRVQCAVTELVDALTDVGAHHITVTKMETD